jgi:ADP-heptose:LPS heptosyltransferase
MIAEIKEELHLGDKICICILLYNIALKENQIIEIKGCKLIETIISEFNLNENLIVKNENYDKKLECLSIKDILPVLKNSNVNFLKYVFFYLEKKIILNEIIIPNQNNYLKKNVTYFQLDNRSEHEKKINLTKFEKIYFLKKQSNYEIIGIGGHDTKKDLPFNYSLGTLSEIINNIKHSKQFLGVDSGISHIAGFFQIPSEIIITHTKDKDIQDIEKFYNVFYQSINFFPRFKFFC